MGILGAPPSLRATSRVSVSSLYFVGSKQSYYVLFLYLCWMVNYFS